MIRVYLFIPGILQHPDGPDDWADAAVAWVANNCPGNFADRYEYRSGALTRWIGQSRRVDELGRLCSMYAAYPITLIGHSNGCELICRMMRKFGVNVRHIHLFAPACDPDFDGNGLNDELLAGGVRTVSIYGSHRDEALELGHWSKVLFGWAGLGYGDLGREGAKNVNPSVRPVVRELWRDDFGHSTWFTAKEFDNTMKLATADQPFVE